MKKFLIPVVLLVLLQGSINAQDSLSLKKKFSASPWLKSYSLYQTSINSDSAAFRQDKVMFGVNILWGKNWSATLGVDFVNFGKGSTVMNAYLKPTKITYTHKNLSFDAGIIMVSQWDVQLKMWGNRYISKTFQDKYGFGNSADLGIRANYTWNKYFSTDISLVSGGGYKLLETSTPYKPAFRAIVRPVKGITVTGYYDYYPENITQSTLATMIDYRNDKKFSVTAEYNAKYNYQFVKGYTNRGLSVYSSYAFRSWLQPLVRYDRIFGKSSDPGINAAKKNGDALIAGLQAKIFKPVRLSVNYQNWRPEAKGSVNEDWIYFCLEFSY